MSMCGGGIMYLYEIEKVGKSLKNPPHLYDSVRICTRSLFQTFLDFFAFRTNRTTLPLPVGISWVRVNSGPL